MAWLLGWNLLVCLVVIILIRNFLKLLNEDFYWKEVKSMADENNEKEGEKKEKEDEEKTE